VDPITPVWATAGNIRLAQALGADDVWVGDHAKSMFPSSAWDRNISPMARFVPNLDACLDPTVAIARWAGRGGPTMGTSVTDAVRRSPADLARVWMSLHHLTRGKAILGIGSGEDENTVPVGLTPEPRVSRLTDVVEAIRAAWASGGEPLTHTGRFHEWQDATFALPHLRGTTPPIWIGAQGPKACELAGRLGDGWIFILNAGYDAWHASAARVALGARTAGRDPDALERSMFFAPLLAPKPDALRELSRAPMVRAMALTLPATVWAGAGVTHPLGETFAGFSELDPADLSPERLGDLGSVITPDLIRELMPFGTAQEVYAQVRPFIDAGVSHTIIYSAMTALKPSLAGPGTLEQRKLMRLLKSSTPGRFDPAAPCSTTPQERT
jgi:phthiodiolone/phenolphthiodiolone dimycocerosates ketoreductase